MKRPKNGRLSALLDDDGKHRNPYLRDSQQHMLVTMTSPRSKFMAAIKTRGTAPEMAIRKVLKGSGHKCVYNLSSLPGRPDVAFPMLKKALFVHGCFWHHHRGCKKGSIPSTNRDFWLRKLGRNAQRDAEQKRLLHKLGWKSFTVWECELRALDKINSKLFRFLGKPTG
jgi:DNA mismatch endonuclease, patch repair protein